MLRRREFLGMIGSAPAAACRPPHVQMIRATVECDLSVVSLVHAMSVVGEGPYTLRVPPEEIGWARVTLARAFRSPSRYADFTIRGERMDQDDNSWALDNGRRMFYSRGV